MNIKRLTAAVLSVPLIAACAATGKSDVSDPANGVVTETFIRLGDDFSAAKLAAARLEDFADQVLQDRRDFRQDSPETNKICKRYPKNVKGGVYDDVANAGEDFAGKMANVIGGLATISDALITEDLNNSDKEVLAVIVDGLLDDSLRMNFEARKNLRDADDGIYVLTSSCNKFRDGYDASVSRRLG